MHAASGSRCAGSRRAGTRTRHRERSPGRSRPRAQLGRGFAHRVDHRRRERVRDVADPEVHEARIGMARRERPGSGGGSPRKGTPARRLRKCSLILGMGPVYRLRRARAFGGAPPITRTPGSAASGERRPLPAVILGPDPAAVRLRRWAEMARPSSSPSVFVVKNASKSRAAGRRECRGRCRSPPTSTARPAGGYARPRGGPGFPWSIASMALSTQVQHYLLQGDAIAAIYRRSDGTNPRAARRAVAARRPPPDAGCRRRTSFTSSARRSSGRLPASVRSRAMTPPPAAFVVDVGEYVAQLRRGDGPRLAAPSSSSRRWRWR